MRRWPWASSGARSQPKLLATARICAGVSSSVKRIPGSPPAHALEEEVQADERLARPGTALDHRRARPWQATEQERVESGDTGGDPIREIDRRLAGHLRSPHARVEGSWR